MVSRTVALNSSVSVMKKPLDFSRGFCITGGSGEIRTRDQRIKRSRGSSKPHVNQWSKGPKNDCAIGCAIAFLVHSSKSRLYIKSRVMVDQPQ